ncbi:DUF1127 domain-containing protein [Marivivens sp. LCG002]|uniref:DUF1127 domain-containing protein n=1 Tax=Marivivens sp. LCG002 TaxID=3051171 RepID=UPI0025578E29|nr:DUF1127 domain-containing protein [Marivivens sp. LCG002]WIV50328.1 DUF1127 domain-containing protein [Marivivens sp. LCG002]
MIEVNQSRALSPRAFYIAYVACLDAIDAVKQAYARHKTKRELEALSDHELADIGLTRSMIDKI